MKTLLTFLTSLNEDATVTYSDKYGNKITNLRSLIEVVEYGNGSLIKNFSLVSGRILAGGRLYKVCL